MKNFSQLYEKLDVATSSNEKVQALVKYFKTEAHANVVCANAILSEKTRKKIMTSKQLQEAAQEFFQIPDWLFRECFVHVGDVAEVISLLFQTLKYEKKEPINISLEQWMIHKIPSLEAMSEAERRVQILDWWARLAPDEVFILNKLISGGFNFGVSEKLVSKALHTSTDMLI